MDPVPAARRMHYDRLLLALSGHWPDTTCRLAFRQKNNELLKLLDDLLVLPSQRESPTDLNVEQTLIEMFAKIPVLELLVEVRLKHDGANSNTTEIVRKYLSWPMRNCLL